MWSLYDYGIRAVIAPSFGDIFFNNSFQNGLLPVVLPAERVTALLTMLEREPGAHLDVDLAAQTVQAPDGSADKFDIDPFRKECLLAGLDNISFTLTFREQIAAFEKKYETGVSWLSRRKNAGMQAVKFMQADRRHGGRVGTRRAAPAATGHAGSFRAGRAVFADAQ